MKLLLLVMVIAADACAGPQRSMTATAAGNLKGRELTVTAPKPALFLAARGGQVPGLVGVMAMSAAGERILRDNAVTDPSPLIAEQITDYLKVHYRVKPSPLQIPASGGDPTGIAEMYPSVDLILDVRTDNWTLEPLPGGAGKYRLAYTADLRLIDAKSARSKDRRTPIVIAHGTCNYAPEAVSVAPTYDDFLADGAQRLIHELDVAALFCIDEFRSKVLTVSPAP